MVKSKIYIYIRVFILIIINSHRKQIRITLSKIYKKKFCVHRESHFYSVKHNITQKINK